MDNDQGIEFQKGAPDPGMGKDDSGAPAHQNGPAGGADPSKSQNPEGDSYGDRVFDITDDNISLVKESQPASKGNIAIPGELRPLPPKMPPQPTPAPKPAAPVNIPRPPVAPSNASSFGSINQFEPSARPIPQQGYPTAPMTFSKPPQVPRTPDIIVPSRVPTTPQAVIRPEPVPQMPVPSARVSPPPAPINQSPGIPLNEGPQTPPPPRQRWESTQKIPASPPAKTVGFTAAEPKQPYAPKPDTLQGIVSTLLPQNLGEKKETAVPQQPPQLSSNPDIKPLRTYETDVADVLSHKKTSTASIAIAESKKEEGTESIKSSEEPPAAAHRGGKLVVALASLVLVAAGAIGGYYLYSISPLYPSKPVANAPQTAVAAIVSADKQSVIAINNLNPNDILSRIRAEVAKTQQEGTVRELIFTTVENGQMTRVDGPTMIQTMDINAPDILTRTITSPWMLGIYTDGAGNQSVFIIATTNFFQNAFAGMLQWESVMADDLKQYLSAGALSGIANVPPAPAVVTASSTAATSSAPEAAVKPYFTLRGTFEDRIIKNKDVREFVTDDGRVLFLYSFVDNAHLVIAGSESALIEIVSRLEKQAFVR